MPRPLSACYFNHVIKIKRQIWNLSRLTCAPLFYILAPVMVDTKKSSKESIFVRDYLAEYRTDLANKRTFLAYIRTALAVSAAGLALIKFFGHPIFLILGAALVVASLLIFVQGLVTYYKMKQVTRAEDEKIRKFEAQGQ